MSIGVFGVFGGKRLFLFLVGCSVVLMKRRQYDRRRAAAVELLGCSGFLLPSFRFPQAAFVAERAFSASAVNAAGS